MSEKKNVPLIVALSIPVLMIVLVAVSIYLPPLFIKPTTDFIYSIEGDYYCRNNTYSYATQMGRVIKSEVKQPQTNQYCNNRGESRLFYYDVKKDAAMEISFEKASGYRVDDTPRSADGFEIVAGGSGGEYFLFGGYDYNSKYLKKGAYSHRINGMVGQPYSYNFKFLGWVKGDGRNG